MNFDYEISEQDFIEAQRLAIQNSSARIIRWSRLVAPLFGAGLLIFLIRAITQQGFSWRVIPALGFCLFFISMPLLNRSKQRQLYTKSLSMQGRLSIDVDESGLQFRGPTFSSQIGWSNFCRFVEDGKTFLLYQNSGVFNIIPKRSLSPEQVESLRAFFNRNISTL